MDTEMGCFCFSCPRSKVHLEIDNRQCAETSNECFSSTDLAASYIAAESLQSQLNYPIISVDSLPGLAFITSLLSYVHFCLFVLL